MGPAYATAWIESSHLQTAITAHDGYARAGPGRDAPQRESNGINRGRPSHLSLRASATGCSECCQAPSLPAGSGPAPSAPRRRGSPGALCDATSSAISPIPIKPESSPGLVESCRALREAISDRLPTSFGGAEAEPWPTFAGFAGAARSQRPSHASAAAAATAAAASFKARIDGTWSWQPPTGRSGPAGRWRGGGSLALGSLLRVLLNLHTRDSSPRHRTPALPLETLEARTPEHRVQLQTLRPARPRRGWGPLAHGHTTGPRAQQPWRPAQPGSPAQAVL